MCCIYYYFFLLLSVDSVISVLCFFFFQAEDGIRDLVRSRGLGDVYKRQRLARDSSGNVIVIWDIVCLRRSRFLISVDCTTIQHGGEAVSYTHLTLPTSDLV